MFIDQNLYINKEQPETQWRFIVTLSFPQYNSKLTQSWQQPELQELS